MTIDRRHQAALFLAGLGVAALIPLLTIVDVVFDLGQGASRLHVSAELALAVIGVVAVAGGLWTLRVTLRRMADIRSKNQHFEQMIEASRDESERLKTFLRRRAVGAPLGDSGSSSGAARAVCSGLSWVRGESPMIRYVTRWTSIVHAPFVGPKGPVVRFARVRDTRRWAGQPRLGPGRSVFR